MKGFLIVGVVFIILGAAVIGYGSFDYTIQEKVLDIGPITATAERTKSVTLPPILGWAILGSGASVLVFGAFRKKI